MTRDLGFSDVLPDAGLLLEMCYHDVSIQQIATNRTGILRTTHDVGPPPQTHAIVPRSVPQASRQRLLMLPSALVGWRGPPARWLARARRPVIQPEPVPKRCSASCSFSASNI